MSELQNTASHFAEAFHVRKRDNGETFYTVEDKDTYAALSDFIRDTIHDGYLPDDFKYQTVFYFINAMAEGQTDYDAALSMMSSDIGLYDLNKWASSNLNRTYYINTVLEEQNVQDLETLLSASQWHEIEEICYQTHQFIEQQAENHAETMEEDEYE